MTDALHVREWLQTIIDAEARAVGRGHTFIGSLDGEIGKVLLERGETFGPRIDLPPGVEYGKAKECFANACRLSALHPLGDESPYRYVEGFAYTPGLIACHHAWVINEAGEVIDPTWRDGGWECPFCDDASGQIAVHVCCEHDDDIEICGCDEAEIGYYEDDVECRMCQGSGRSPHEHPSREGTEYLGIVIPRDTLIETIMETGTYGVLGKDVALP